MGSTAHATSCRLLCFLIALSLAGCTSLRPVEHYDDELPPRIRAENLIKEGDHVVIHTRETGKHEFRVVAVDDEVVKGDDITIPIDDIIALEKLQFSAVKSVVVFVVAAYGVLWLMVGLTWG